MSIKLLSHFISPETPLYGNGTGTRFINEKQIKNGDSCNTLNLQFSNHIGTHIDFPYHFDDAGKKLKDYRSDFWEFNNVKIVDISSKVSDRQMIGPDFFIDLNKAEIDLLLIKTGYGLYRGTDRYTLTPPGLSSDLASFFRKYFPKLRCIGLDLISISSFSNREEGRKAHVAFLNPTKGEPILLIEDMKLNSIAKLSKVIVAPLLIESADGAPCTVLAYTE